jgi:hypothetical protein
MRWPQNRFSLLVLALGATAVLASCGPKSSDNSAPNGPTVDATAYEGKPGKFSSLYTGTCVIQTAARSYTNCSTRVRIQQTPYMIFVRTQFFLNPSNHSNLNLKIVGRSQDTLSISGKSLISNKQEVGTIGRHGFYFSRAGQPYHFVWLYPNTFEYSGTFVDDSGRSVLVTARVHRGSAVQSSSRRVSKAKRSK